MFGHHPKTVSEWFTLAYPDPVYRQETMERWKPYHGAAQLSSRAVNTGEYQITCRDGSIKICEIYAQYTPDQLIVTFHDVSERKQAEQEIHHQLAEKETLLKEVHHRIKNNMAQIESLLSLQADSFDNSDVKYALQKAISRVKSTRTLYDNLLIRENYDEVLMKKYLENLIDSLVELFDMDPNVTIEKRLDDFTLSPRSAVPVGIILNELLTNVFKYAFEGTAGDKVLIKLEKGVSQVTLTVADNGVGFKKRTGVNITPGFGITIINMIAEQFEGAFTIDGENGTTCSVTLHV